MIVHFGTGKLRANSADLTISRKALRNDADVRYGEEQVWRLKINLISQLATPSATIADIKAKTAACEAIFATENKTLRLTDDSGTDTAHVLDNSTTEGGVRILEPPSYPVGRGTEVVTHRTVTVVLSATLIDDISDIETGNILSFQESIDWEASGTERDVIKTLRGPGVPQTTCQIVPTRVRQSGTAVGLRSHPDRPPPIWPTALMRSRPTFRKQSPKRRGADHSEYPIRWSYDYVSPYDLAGSPNLWGVTYV